MLQLKNTTPFAANLAVLSDEEGIESVYINVKARFKIGAQWTLTEYQPPPQAEDSYWGEPALSSLVYASDFHPGKASTDVVMVGQACAADKQPVTQLDVSVAVGNKSKTCRVFGDRIWQDGIISRPAPFQVMPLVYERAYGGTLRAGDDPESNVIAAEERNPVGQGFSGGRGHREMQGQALPNLEDPRCLIRSIDDQPEPACFGFKAPNWRPRAGYAGTYDERWQQQRAPYLPTDYDSRFLNAAHPDLICDGFLRGGEAVKITNMHPGGDLHFNLPHIKLVARIDSDDTSKSPGAFNLETVLLEPNELQLSLVWKAKFRCDKKTLKIKQITVGLSR